MLPISNEFGWMRVWSIVETKLDANLNAQTLSALFSIRVHSVCIR